MENKELVYRNRNTDETFSFLKGVVPIIALFFFSIYTIQIFNLFGKNVLAPFTAIMWAFGTATTIVLPSQRKETIKETEVTIGIYLVSLIVVRELVKKISGISAEMIMATYNMNMPVTSGSAFSGYLQTMMWIITIMTPVSFIGLQIKKIFTMRRNMEKKKYHDRLLNADREERS